MGHPRPAIQPQLRASALSLILTAVAASLATDVAQAGQLYEITVTNVTRGQQFTPFLAASHDSSVKLFELGMPASPELAALAEGGATDPLMDLLATMPGIGDLATSAGLLGPGASVTLMLEAGGPLNHFSLAAMLIPTNDAFVALNGVAGPGGQTRLTVMVPAYDAGSERNDELCASIPGPDFVECDGPGGGGSPGQGEGHVHVHAGMHGVGDLDEAERDWRNPVARITIRRAP